MVVRDLDRGGARRDRPEIDSFFPRCRRATAIVGDPLTAADFTKEFANFARAADPFFKTSDDVAITMIAVVLAS